MRRRERELQAAVGTWHDAAVSTRPGFNESWPDDGRPSRLEIDRLLDDGARYRRLRHWVAFAAVLSIGFGVGEFGKLVGWW